MNARQPNLPINTKQEALILASIIEKETSLKTERGKVSSVFVNRLLREIALQTDAYRIRNYQRKKVLGRAS